MIELEETSGGVILPVRAQPGAKKNGIVGAHAGQLKVAVTQTAEKGKANNALHKVLAAELEIKRSQVSLVSGLTRAQKKFLISGMDLGELRRRIAAKLDKC